MRCPAALALLVTIASGATLPAPALAARGEGKTALQDESTRTLYLALIREARTDGRTRAALAYLDDFDRRHPGQGEAQILRVNCLLDLDQVDAAQAALARIPSSDRSGPALAVRGHVLAAQGQWSEATMRYAAAREASPADAMIVNALGYAQLRSGQASSAVETLRAAFDLAPDNAVVRNNLGLALTMAGRSAEAARLLSGLADVQERQRLGGQFSAEAARLTLAGGGVVPGAK